jgi:hypothetical protein
MESIKIRTHVGRDGILNLRVPVPFSEKDVEVVVEVREPATTSTSSGPESLGWPKGYFEETYGSFRDEPLFRADQGEYEKREELD